MVGRDPRSSTRPHDTIAMAPSVAPFVFVVLPLGPICHHSLAPFVFVVLPLAGSCHYPLTIRVVSSLVQKHTSIVGQRLMLLRHCVVMTRDIPHLSENLWTVELLSPRLTHQTSKQVFRFFLPTGPDLVAGFGNASAAQRLAADRFAGFQGFW